MERGKGSGDGALFVWRIKRRPVPGQAPAGRALRREGEQLVALRDADMALLGAEERESLEWAIRYVQDMNFEQLRTASHDAAWQKTAANAPIAWHDIIATLDPEARERLMEKFI